MTSDQIAVAATIGCALAVGCLLVAEMRAWHRGRFVAKPLAAACFVAVALARSAADPSPYAALLLIALALGALGDVALMFRARAAFLVGLGLFALGHGASLSAIAHISPPESWLGWRSLAPVAVGGFAVVSLWPHLARFGVLRVAVLGYAALFVVVECAALSAWSLGTLQGERLAAGMTLFFASDLAVARHRFVAPSIANKLWGQPAYFAGQVLIAWSIGAA